MHSTLLSLSVASLAAATRLGGQPNVSYEARHTMIPFDIHSRGAAIGACGFGDTSVKWTSQSTWPVVKETSANICLARGTIEAETPVLVETYAGAQPICNIDGWAVADDMNMWDKATKYHKFADRGYFIILPLDGMCTERNPCGMTVFLHGDVDHKPNPTMPIFNAAAADADCRGRLRSVLVFPQLPENERWDLPLTKTPVEEFVVPLTKSLLRQYSHIVDDKRVFVSGYSNGAAGALLAAIGYPDIFSAAMVSSLGLGPDESTMKGVSYWDVPNHTQAYITMKKKRDARYASAKGSATSSKLKAIAFSKGSIDTKNVDVFLKRLDSVLKETDLLGTTSIQVRIYPGEGHGIWNDEQISWTGHFAVMFSGTCDLRSPGAGCASRWNSGKSGSSWIKLVGHFVRAHYWLALLVVVAGLALVGGAVNFYKRYLSRSSSKSSK